MIHSKVYTTETVLNGLAYIIKTADMHIPVSGSIALMMSYCVHKWSLVGVG